MSLQNAKRPQNQQPQRGDKQGCWLLGCCEVFDDLSYAQKREETGEQK